MKKILMMIAVCLAAGCASGKDGNASPAAAASETAGPEETAVTGKKTEIPYDAEPETIRVWDDGMYGRSICKWEKPAYYGDSSGDYTVIIESVSQDGSTAEMISGFNYYEYLETTDFIGWVCQNDGFPYRMRFHVIARDRDALIAEGYSSEFDPRSFFPEQEVLVIGTDIPEKDIEELTYHSNGSSMQSNFRLSVEKEDDGSAEIEGNFFRNSREVEVNRKLGASDWEELMALIRQGEVRRKYVMDPEIEMLDGSESWLKLEWDDETDLQEMWYIFQAGEDIEEQIIEWMYSRAE